MQKVAQTLLKKLLFPEYNKKQRSFPYSLQQLQFQLFLIILKIGTVRSAHAQIGVSCRDINTWIGFLFHFMFLQSLIVVSW
jgi:hypothetical protein